MVTYMKLPQQGMTWRAMTYIANLIMKYLNGPFSPPPELTKSLNSLLESLAVPPKLQLSDIDEVERLPSPNLLLLESPPEMSISPIISPIINSFPGVTPPPPSPPTTPEVQKLEPVPADNHPLSESNDFLLRDLNDLFE